MKTKTIGILTLQNSNNYGAMYQTYALSAYLKNKGCEVFILDYEMTRDSSNLSDYLIRPVAFLQKLIYKKELVVNMIFQKRSTNHQIDRKSNFVSIFDEFRRRYLIITTTKYNYESLKSNHPGADVFICGSDQIWAADFLFTSPAFLLGFVPKGVKRVSYAASFGKNRLEPYLKNTFSSYINKFDAISVREKSGVDIVKSFTSNNVTHVLDPTLILDKEDYAEIIDYSLIPEGPYMLVYKLEQGKLLSDWMDACINEVNREQKLSILAVSTNLTHPFNDKWREIYPTPGQLLGFIEKSSVTITNSFHGTVFSILLQTRFLSFARDIYIDKQNVRMEGLLSDLNLEDFYCEPFLDVEEVSKKLKKQYKYKSAFKELSKMRRSSQAFLDQAIS
jgi:hypothetical protein